MTASCYDAPHRAAKAAATRRKILEAARSQFVEHGYTATKVAQIARTATVSVDTVYASVGRKPALLRELVETSLSGTDDVVCSLVLAAYGSLMLGDTPAAGRDATEAVELLAPIGDSWGLVHAHAMIGGIAQAEHRFDDAARALTHAVRESENLGFVGQAALHRATLARVQQRAGRGDQAADSFDAAIAAALACGDGRLASTARINLARLLRARGDHADAVELLKQNQRWYHAAGGGEGALLNRCLLHAETNDRPSLSIVLEEAGATENSEVQVYALDALARIATTEGDRQHAEELLETADSLAAVVTHLVDEPDRLDKAQAQHLMTVRPQPSQPQ